MEKDIYVDDNAPKEDDDSDNEVIKTMTTFGLDMHEGSSPQLGHMESMYGNDHENDEGNDECGSATTPKSPEPQTMSSVEDPVLFVPVSASAICLIAIPLYIYGAVHFYKQRLHIFIQKRFPISVISIAAASLLNGIIHQAIWWIRYAVDIEPIPDISQALSYVVYTLVNMRLGLVYYRWKQQQRLLSESMPSAIPKSWVIFTTLAATFGSFAIFMYLFFPDGYQPIFPAAAWTFALVVTFVLIIVIVSKKVKDGIGCLKETIAIWLFMLFVIFVRFFENISPFFEILWALVINVALIAQGLIPLFGSLYYANKMKDASKDRSISVVELQNDSLLPLKDFLKKQKNYQIFREYLSYCWALENLLFLESVCILNHSITVYKNVHLETSKTEIGPDEDEDEERAVPRMTFDYLTNCHEEYKLTSNGKTTTELGYDAVKDKISEIQRQLYEKFIPNGAPNEINISFKNRVKLDELMKERKAMESLDDCLHLFDDALMEIYKLLLSMYGYEFASFLQRNEFNVN